MATGHRRRHLPRRVVGPRLGSTPRSDRDRLAGHHLDHLGGVPDRLHRPIGVVHNRTRWFIRHLLDLAVVALPLLRPLRLLRLVVLVAALQKAIGGAIRGRVIVYTACSVVLLVYVASLAILDTERYELARRSPPSVMRCGGPSPPSPPWDTATYHRSRARARARVE